MYCCEDDLKKMVWRIHATIENDEENVILEKIKCLAVKSESYIVARVNHMKMRQGTDEPVRTFASRLVGQANICEYNLEVEVDCECSKKIKTTVNFSEQVTGQIIISNLSDSEIQRDLLSALNTKTNAMTLNETINYIESKESGKNSAMQLSNTQRINAIHSSYKKNSRPPKNALIQQPPLNKITTLQLHTNNTTPRRYAAIVISLVMATIQV